MQLPRLSALALSAPLLATATPTAARAEPDEVWDYADPPDSSVDVLPRPSPPEPTPPKEAPTADLSAAGYLGVVTGVGGIGMGVQPLGRYGMLGFGGFMEWAGGLGGSYVGGGALAGLSLRIPSRFRGDLLGAVGFRGYAGWGARWFSDDPGAHAMLPHAGLRLRGSWLASPAARDHFEIGAEIFGDQDLYRRHVEYDYLETGERSFFGDEGRDPYFVHESKDVGGANVGFLLTLGTTVDFR